MYNIIIYPNSSFDNIEKLIVNIFESSGIEFKLCEIENCCQTNPCKLGNLYQLFKTKESFDYIQKFRRNQKYLIFYQKNIVEVAEKAYIQDNTIEKNGTDFLEWIQQNKLEYQSFSSRFLQSSSKSVMYVETSQYEKDQFTTIRNMISFLESKYPFDSELIFKSIKWFEQNYANNNTNILFKQFLEMKREEANQNIEDMNEQIESFYEDGVLDENEAKLEIELKEKIDLEENKIEEIELKEEEIKEEEKQEAIEREKTFDEKMNELYLEILLEKEFRLKNEIDKAIIETPEQQPQRQIQNPNRQRMKPNQSKKQGQKPKPIKKVHQKQKQNLNRQIQIAKMKNFHQKVLRLKSLQKLIETKFNLKK